MYSKNTRCTQRRPGIQGRRAESKFLGVATRPASSTCRLFGPREITECAIHRHASEAYRQCDGGKQTLLADSEVPYSVCNSRTIYRFGNKLGRLDATKGELPLQLGKSLVGQDLRQTPQNIRVTQRRVLIKLMNFSLLSLNRGNPQLPVIARRFTFCSSGGSRGRMPTWLR